MRVKIQVTAEHVKTGRRRNCGYCPVAMAMNVHLKEGFYGFAGTSEVWINRTPPPEDPNDTSLHEVERSWDMPRKIVEWVACFDACCQGSPISFILDIPKKYLKPGTPPNW